MTKRTIRDYQIDAWLTSIAQNLGAVLQNAAAVLKPESVKETR